MLEVKRTVVAYGSESDAPPAFRVVYRYLQACQPDDLACPPNYDRLEEILSQIKEEEDRELYQAAEEELK